MPSGRIVRLDSRKKRIGLTETERHVLPAELTEIMAELDELQEKATEIAARVQSPPSSARSAG